MSARYLQTVFTDSVRAAQTRNNSRAAYARLDGAPTAPDELSDLETAFIAARDSFYLASTGESGWPYVQHRGGPKGFVRALGPRLLGFADYRGNRQYVSVGNVAADPRVALIFMDYPARARMKLLGRMRAVEIAEAGDLADALAPPSGSAKIERLLLIDVEAFDWNCPQHITPRYSMDEIEPAMNALKSRIEELEAEIARLAP